MNTLLILHASAGNGHRSVARAIHEAASPRAEESGFALVMADALNFSGPLFRAAYGKGYEFLAQYFRWCCHVTYALTDAPGTENILTRGIQRYSAAAIAGLSVFLKENAIRTVCCTHFLPVTLLSLLRRQRRYDGTIHVCVTDYDVHGFWVSPEVDTYYVASGRAAERLKSWGIPQERVKVTGIPVRRDFASRETKPLPFQTPRILFAASSLKVRETVRLLEEMALVPSSLDVTLVTGRNTILFEALSSYTPPGNLRLSVRGFESHMETLMREADLIITKPGGITCTEALCSGLPMFFVSPIPVQETLNAHILSEAGAGVECFKRGLLAANLQRCLKETAVLQRMRLTCRKLAQPDAAERIVTHLLEKTSEWA